MMWLTLYPTSLVSELSMRSELKTYEGQVPHHVGYIYHCVPISLGAFIV